MYNVYKIENNKLVQMFSKSYTDLKEVSTALSYWYEVKRNDINTEFLIINQEDGKSLILNYDAFNEK